MARLLFLCYYVTMTSQLFYYVIIVSVHVRSGPETSLQGACTKRNHNIKTTGVCRGESYQDDYLKYRNEILSLFNLTIAWGVLLVTNC